MKFRNWITANMEEMIYGTAVSLDGYGVLIKGSSGSGKSDLALRLIDRGAQLIADDQVIMQKENNHLLLSAPEKIKGLMEVRGVGILSFDTVQNIPLVLVVCLADMHEEERLPEPQFTHLKNTRIPQLILDGRSKSLHIKVELALTHITKSAKSDRATTEIWGIKCP